MELARTITQAALEAAQDYPVVVITGPRQSGKTTLVRRIFPAHPYVLLEDPDRRRYATEDPRRFLADLPDGAVLDEVQRVPELLSYLQGIVDHDPRPGRFILTGSQQFGLLSGITQSLAGRAAMMVLLPFSLQELSQGRPFNERLDEVLWRGFYPPIHDRGLDPGKWYGNYILTYVERDVRQLVNVRDLGSFETFLRMCAGRCGQLLNLSGLASDCGISHNTARSWLSVLEASYIIHLLSPHFSNFTKRLIKSPKLYFIDPGLAAWLLDIRSSRQLASHPMRGALFESWIFSELLRGAYNRGDRPGIFFWRDRSGLEIDFLAKQGNSLMPIEAKSGGTFVWEWLTPLERWAALAGDRAGKGWIVYGGEEGGSRRGFEAVPWKRIGSLVDSVAGG